MLWREWHRKLPSRWPGRFWAGYTAISALASLLAIWAYYLNPKELTAAMWVNACGVSIGLLLLCVSAASTLSEERDRGSLDIIMATPLPTSTIVWGKWWGTFAMVPRLLILPTWVAVGVAMISGHGLAALLMVGLILAYAAAIVSFGLALSTWMPRVGRVVTTIIIVYAMASIGWPILHESYGYRSNGGWPTYPGATQGSPFVGILVMTMLSARFDLGFTQYGHGDAAAAEAYGWALAWIIIYGAIAGLFALATRLSFDHYMGRASETPRLRPPPIVPKPGKAAIPEAVGKWS